MIELWLAMLRLIRQPDDGSIAFCRSLAEQARASAGRQSEHQALGLLWLALGTVLLGRWEVADAASALTAADHQLTAAGTVPWRCGPAAGWPSRGAQRRPRRGGGAVRRAARRGARPIRRRRAWRTIAAAQVAIERDDLLLALRLLDDADPAVDLPAPR